MNIYQPHLMRIVEITDETVDTRTLKLEFKAPEMAREFQFSAGQFGEYSVFGEGESAYDKDKEISYGLMFHGFDYPDETGEEELEIQASQSESVLLIRVAGRMDSVTSPEFERRVSELTGPHTPRVALDLERQIVVIARGNINPHHAQGFNDPLHGPP